MGSILRIGLPLLALVAGTWVGLGRPSGTQVGREAARAAAHALPPAAPLPVVDAPPPPPVAPLSPLAHGDVPDTLPWPRLNKEVSVNRAWLLADGPERRATDGRRFVTFTFDDGPAIDTTPMVMKTLEHFDVRATFFLIGRYLDGTEPRDAMRRDLVRRLAEQGHLIGNHTHDHVLLSNTSHARALKQIDTGEASIARALGSKPILFRPPYGGLDAFTQDALRKRNVEMVLWSIEAGDMTREDEDGLADSIIGQIEYAGGGTVLMHDVRWVTVRALPRVLEWLKKHPWDPKYPERVGYEVVDLPAYLRATEARPQPFADRTELERARSLEFVSRKQAPPPKKRDATQPGV